MSRDFACWPLSSCLVEFRGERLPERESARWGWSGNMIGQLISRGTRCCITRTLPRRQLDSVAGLQCRVHSVGVFWNLLLISGFPPPANNVSICKALCAPQRHVSCAILHNRRFIWCDKSMQKSARRESSAWDKAKMACGRAQAWYRY